MNFIIVLGLTVCLLMIMLGITALALPDRVWPFAQFTTTANGVYVAGGIRLVIGLAFLLAASSSRFPLVLRVFGILALLAGVATLALGAQGARTIANALTDYGTNAVRALGIFVLLVGSFVAYAITTHHAESVKENSQG